MPVYGKVVYMIVMFVSLQHFKSIGLRLAMPPLLQTLSSSTPNISQKKMVIGSMDKVITKKVERSIYLKIVETKSSIVLTSSSKSDTHLIV